MKNSANEPRNNIRALREAAGLSQAALAEAIQADVGTVSRWERGTVTPPGPQQARIAAALNTTVAALGIPDRTPVETTPLAFLQEPPTVPVDQRVTASQKQWLTTRRGLNTHRAALAEGMARIYGDDMRVGGTTLLAAPGWLPDRPADLADVDLVAVDAPAPQVAGTEPETVHVRPLADIARPYARYTHAIRDIAKPRLFDSRLSWRPMAVDWAGGRGSLTFGETTYFEAMDVHEGLAHEAAYVCLTPGGRPGGQLANLRALPFRHLVRDPFDLARRPSIASVSTLVVRGGGEPTFLLHRRDSTAVAIAGSMIHVVPTGIFQPSSAHAAAKAADFDLWRNAQREFAEELLGYDECNGDGRPVDYTAEPFATLDAARAAGTLRVSCLGVGLDALTLAFEILTVAVFDPAVYDELATDFVATNDEGTLVAERVAFDEATVKGLLESGRMAPAAAGLLHLAWQHRADLVDS